LAKCGFAERKFSGWQWRLAKLQRPPPEIRIFFPRLGVLEHSDAAPALASFDGAHQARRAAAENECIEGMDHHR